MSTETRPAPTDAHGFGATIPRGREAEFFDWLAKDLLEFSQSVGLDEVRTKAQRKSGLGGSDEATRQEAWDKMMETYPAWEGYHAERAKRSREGLEYELYEPGASSLTPYWPQRAQEAFRIDFSSLLSFLREQASSTVSSMRYLR